MTAFLRLLNDLAFLRKVRDDDNSGRRVSKGLQDSISQSDDFVHILQDQYDMAENDWVCSAEHCLAVLKVIFGRNLVRHVTRQRLLNMLHRGLSTVTQRRNNQDREHGRMCYTCRRRYSRVQVRALLHRCMRIIRVRSRVPRPR